MKLNKINFIYISLYFLLVFYMSNCGDTTAPSDQNNKFDQWYIEVKLSSSGSENFKYTNWAIGGMEGLYYIDQYCTTHDLEKGELSRIVFHGWTLCSCYDINRWGITVHYVNTATRSGHINDYWTEVHGYDFNTGQYKVLKIEDISEIIYHR